MEFNHKVFIRIVRQTSIRGALGSFLQLFITFGLLYSYVIGPYVSYTVFWILCACLPVVFFVLFMLMPESPYYLISKGNREAAVASLAKLRSKSEAAVQEEANDIRVRIRFYRTIGIRILIIDEYATSLALGRMKRVLDIAHPVTYVTTRPSKRSFLDPVKRV